MPWCARANAPCGSNLKNTRAQALMKFSWNIRWWNDRCHPLTWTKTADEILPYATRKRDSDARH